LLEWHINLLFLEVFGLTLQLHAFSCMAIRFAFLVSNVLFNYEAILTYPLCCAACM
jgi:hypothetical protein